MENVGDRWRFYDFGTLQYVCDTWSGETFKVFGSSSMFADEGPFYFEVEDGRPKLVPLEGVGDGVTHFLDEHSSWDVSTMQTDDGQLQTMIQHKTCGDKPGVLIDAMQREKCSKALLIPLGCQFKPFKARCFLYGAPTLLGDIHVSVRFDFPWLVAYIFGPANIKRCHQYAQWLRRSVEELGWASEHVTDSVLARKKRSLDVDETHDVIDSRESGTGWSVSICGALHFLNKVMASKKWRIHCGRACLRQLMESLLLWPLDGQRAIAWRCVRSDCEVLIQGTTVDFDVLYASESERPNENGEKPVARGRPNKRNSLLVFIVASTVTPLPVTMLMP